MEVTKYQLSDLYPFLGGSDGVLTAWLQHDIDDPRHMDPQPRPALLILPGGGYGHCSPREGEPVAIAFGPLGFNCFVLNYSVAPHCWPLALREVAAAVDLICQNAKKWNIDTDRIVLCGFSAGGHLAASYCTRRELPAITAVISPKPVRAALLGYPVITADPALRHSGSFLNLLGTGEISPADEEKFSLENHVRAGLTPPTFLWHAADDPSVPVENSLLYARALSREKIPFELHIFPAGGHGASTCDRQTIRDYALPEYIHLRQWIPLAQQWLKQVLDI